MGKVTLTMSMSLDGFVAGNSISKTLPMGEDGLRLHDWMFKELCEIDTEIVRDLHASTGAVILGKRTFDVGVDIWEDTPYAAPCFVLTHEKKEKRAEKSGTFTFVNDGIESALRQAKKFAGDKNIMLMGANTAQQFLNTGLFDELQLQIVPRLLGKGLRLFGYVENKTIESRKRKPSSLLLSPIFGFESRKIRHNFALDESVNLLRTCLEINDQVTKQKPLEPFLYDKANYLCWPTVAITVWVGLFVVKGSLFFQITQGFESFVI